MDYKDFQSWQGIKRSVHNELPRVFFEERDIWFCYLGENIGFEQDGRGDNFLRPVLILKKFNHEVLWAVPLTHSVKRNHPYYFTFLFRDDENSTAILSQLRLIDAKRLKYKAGTIAKLAFAELKTKIRQLLA